MAKKSKAWHKRQSRKKAMRYQKHIDSVNGKMRVSRYNWGDGPSFHNTRSAESFTEQIE